MNAFTVDVEDYYHVSAFEKTISRQRWCQFDSRVVDNTRRLLRLLERHQVRATFFVLGWVARQCPHLIHEIDHAGHEIGSHSYWHRLVYDQTPEQFRHDLRLARDVLENLIGKPVTSFRAASFSITRRSLWALDVLVDEGFTLDSSIFAVRHDRYGIPNAEPHPHQIHVAGGSLWECPPTVVRLAGMNVPVAGGGYFRVLPGRVTTAAFDYVNRRLGRPCIFYIHPWEIDPHQPRLPAAGFAARCRHYVNLHSTERKLELLLRQVRFGRLSDVLACKHLQQHAKGVALPGVA